jgi:hypothetical protein
MTLCALAVVENHGPSRLETRIPDLLLWIRCSEVAVTGNILLESLGLVPHFSCLGSRTSAIRTHAIMVILPFTGGFALGVILL